MSATPSGVATRELLGCPIHAMTIRQVLKEVDRAIRTRRRLRIGVVNAAKLVNMQRSAELREDVLSSDLILADGMSVVWAARLLGRPLPERVAGIDLMQEMLKAGNEVGYRVYCLGATPAILDAAIERIARDYPKVVVVGRHHGFFVPEEESAIAGEISAARADILFVAMSSPLKERFLARWSDSLDVPVWHGVGGSFDVLAGHVRRAPDGWQRLGLEWLYRVKQEPRRLWRRYLVTNTVFCEMVILELMRQLPRRHRV